MAGVSCLSGLCLAQPPWEMAPGLTLPLHLQQAAGASLKSHTPRLEYRILGPCFFFRARPGSATCPHLGSTLGKGQDKGREVMSFLNVRGLESPF